MAKRSVHLSEKGEAIVAFLSDTQKNGGSNYSGSINAVLELAENLAKTAKPELSEEEWAYLCNIYGSEISFMPPFNISSDIVDDAFQDERNPKTILLSMMNKSSKWTQCEQLAVLWEVKRRWQEINKKRIRISF